MDTLPHIWLTGILISLELDKLEIDYVIPDLPGGERPHADINGSQHCMTLFRK